MFRKWLLKRLNAELDEALKIRAMAPEEVANIRARAPGMDWLTILTILMEIIQMIIDFLDR